MATTKKPSDTLWRYISTEERLNDAIAEVERLRAAFGEAQEEAYRLVKEKGAIEGYCRVFALDDDERLTVVPVASMYQLDREHEKRGDDAPASIYVTTRDEPLAGAAASFGDDFHDLPDDDVA